MSIFQIVIGHHVEFVKGQNFISRGRLADHVKFYQNWSIYLRDIAIFQFFSMVTAL